MNAATGTPLPPLSHEQRQWLHETYQHLHRHPELSMQEHRTADYIAEQLAALGLESFRCGGTGVVAVIRNGDGPVVAFRADTDALPIAEDTGLAYTSTARGTLADGQEVPVMHGCGHDTHVASALGAAAALLSHREQWSGTLVLIFQPGEETAQGSRAMLDDGLWERAPRPAVVLGQHVGPLPVGTVHVSSGPAMAMADSLRVTVFGKQAHGSKPDVSIDPIVLASAIVMRLQTIVSREVDTQKPAVVTVGTFHAGLKENIIPDRAELTLNIRTLEPEVRAQVLSAVERIIRAEAMASNAPEPLIEPIYDFPQCYNDPAAAEQVLTSLRAEFGDDAHLVPPLMGSEDVGELWAQIGVPGVYWFFGGFDPDDGPPPINHSPHFAPLMEPTLDTGVRAALAGLLTYLGPDAIPAPVPAGDPA